MHPDEFKAQWARMSPEPFPASYEECLPYLLGLLRRVRELESDKIARAIGALNKNPALTDEEVAKSIGVSRRTLLRSPAYVEVRKLHRKILKQARQLAARNLAATALEARRRARELSLDSDEDFASDD